MNKTTADRPHDAPGFTPTRSLRFAAQATGAYRRIFASSPAAQILSRPSPVRYSGFDMTLDVKSVRFECDDVLSVTLTPREDITLPSWIPGAHLDVFLPSGRQRQ
ncbi:MAG: oxidoreductase, partial [Rhodococcus sp. (in: high G+C Gram-positive bacteria)]